MQINFKTVQHSSVSSTLQILVFCIPADKRLDESHYYRGNTGNQMLCSETSVIRGKIMQVGSVSYPCLYFAGISTDTFSFLTLSLKSKRLWIHQIIGKSLEEVNTIGMEKIYRQCIPVNIQKGYPNQPLRPFANATLVKYILH